VQPPPIVDVTTLEVIPDVFQSCPQYWAASLAKLKEQSYGEADAFDKRFQREVIQTLNSAMTRRSINPGQ
jgi:hypothetical protein